MEVARKRTHTITVCICDRCKTRSARHKCPACGRDICSGCGRFWDTDLFTNDDNGDYPPLVCKPCDDLARLVCQRAIEILEEADRQIEAIIDGWKATCRNRES